MRIREIFTFNCIKWNFEIIELIRQLFLIILNEIFIFEIFQREEILYNFKPLSFISKRDINLASFSYFSIPFFLSTRTFTKFNFHFIFYPNFSFLIRSNTNFGLFSLIDIWNILVFRLFIRIIEIKKFSFFDINCELSMIAKCEKGFLESTFRKIIEIFELSTI